jgi:hypothetical protein
MTCTLWSTAGCLTQGWQITYDAAQPDLRTSGWNDVAHGVSCHRRDKTLLLRSEDAPAHELAVLNPRAESTSQLGSCIDLCKDINYGNCINNICNPDYFCQRTLLRDNGLSSVRFYGDMSCDLFDNDSCIPSTHEQATLWEATPDLRTVGWNDRVKGIKCHRRDKTLTLRAEDLVLRDVVSFASRDIEETELGTCIDLCVDTNYHSCSTNICK